MSDVVLTGSTGLTRANSSAVDEDDEKNPEEDNSDADTVRMSTPDYERWASENCRIKSQNLFLTESTPTSTFFKYRNCYQCEHTQIAQTHPPAARGEPNKVGDSRKETMKWPTAKRVRGQVLGTWYSHLQRNRAVAPGGHRRGVTI